MQPKGGTTILGTFDSVPAAGVGLWVASGPVMLTNSITISSGNGTPEGAVTAVPGSIYLRRDGGAGTSFYVKQSGTGNTGWVAK